MCQDSLGSSDPGPGRFRLRGEVLWTKTDTDPAPTVSRSIPSPKLTVMMDDLFLSKKVYDRTLCRTPSLCRTHAKPR